MKQRTLLALLPFALVVTGCGSSGGLEKGKLFTAKFMKQNFASEPVALSYEYKNPEKVDLNFPEGATVTKYMDGGNADVLQVVKDGKKGLFCTQTNTFAIPLDAGLDSLGTVQSGVAEQQYKRVKFYTGTKNVDATTKLRMIFDDYGNKLYEGLNEGYLNVGMDFVDKYERDEKGYLEAKVVAGSELVAVAYYNVDRTFKELISPEDFYNRNPYASFGESMAKYGHKGLRLVTNTEGGGIRNSVFDTEKHEFISSFVVPDSAVWSQVVGDSVLYQVRNQLPDRAKKYQVSIGEDKFNYETFSINYLTGKVSKIKTNLLLDTADALKTKEQLDEEGLVKYLYIEQVQEIGENKVASSVKKDIILDEKLKVAADVTGIDYGSLKLFDKEHLISSKNFVYDFELKETCIFNHVDPDAMRVATVNNKKTIIDAKGKYLVDPIYDSIKLVAQDNVYLLESAKEYKFATVTDEGINLTGAISKTEYIELAGDTTLPRFEKFRYFTKLEDSSKVMFDALTGQIIEEVAPLDGSTSLHMMDGHSYLAGLASSLKYRCDVYTKDSSVYMIRQYQKINYGYLPIE